MKNLILLILLMCSFAGCVSDKQRTGKKDTLLSAQETDTIILIAPAKPSAETKVFRGLYILGNKTSTITDCNQNRTYVVEDESNTLRTSYKETTSGNLSYPLESVYAEVEGYLKAKTDEDEHSGSRQVLVVSRVISVKQKSFDTDCFKYDFVALGTEPFWSLEIIASEKVIVLKDASHEKTYIFPYIAAKVSKNQTIYETSTSKNERLKVFITKEPCSDGMSDRNYQYSAKVELNERSLRGCAIKKGDKITMNH